MLQCNFVLYVLKQKKIAKHLVDTFFTLLDNRKDRLPLLVTARRIEVVNLLTRLKKS